MAKRKRETNEKVINHRIKEGRGQAAGADYQPWLRIQDVPSQGLAHRIKGWKTGRVHHLLSNLELSYFYTLEWSPMVIDIREQYPLLPLEETLALAQQCGVKHPTDPKTKEPVVMTTDFLITLADQVRPIEQARTVKPASKLAGQRVQQKLEIERRYWRNRGIDWGVVTEHEIGRVVAQNIGLLHGYHHLTDRLDITEPQLEAMVAALTECVLVGEYSLREAGLNCDRRLGFEAGTGLTVAYHLLVTRRWQTDLTIPLDPGHKLVLSAASEKAR
jgi:hypothetical protein